MADDRVSDYFIDDVEDDLDDDLLTAPVVVPSPDTGAASAAARPGARPYTPEQAPPQEPPAPATMPEPTRPPRPRVERPVAAPAQRSREDRLADALNGLMSGNPDIQASALVSMDGFTMASALPRDMQEDRVGAMSAAILGLGERAAAELGRGELSQVYIEGDDGIVVLISVGARAVLTALASPDARLGLVLFDMRSVSQEIAAALG